MEQNARHDRRDKWDKMPDMIGGTSGTKCQTGGTSGGQNVRQEGQNVRHDRRDKWDKMPERRDKWGDKMPDKRDRGTKCQTGGTSGVEMGQTIRLQGQVRDMGDKLPKAQLMNRRDNNEQYLKNVHEIMLERHCRD